MKRALFLLTALVLLHGPGTVGAPPKATDDDDPDKPGKITGIPITRPNGTFLGIEIKDGNFKLTFYNAKKKPIPVDVARAILRWPVHYQPNQETAILSNPASDGHALTSEKVVRAPHDFKLYISLFAEGAENAVETYVVDYHD